ncbi:MAG: tRNA preQ1(34) S-adenosylmethionine ribosyltransferase-isomerase QueA [Patescibacteria group bacterium]
MNLDDYNYFLPEKNLALEPAVPRDSSKLFIYDTIVDKIIFDHFYNLDKYLPKNSFMVMNNTKVLPARVTMKKESGGKIILLFLVNELTDSRIVKIMADREIAVGEKVYFDTSASLSTSHLTVVGQKENIFDLRFNFSRKHLFLLLKKYGVMPIPPYLKKSTLTRDELLKKYQTIFAKTDGSAAAPTASLHFTDKVFDKLDQKSIKKYFVTLHVGMGTFAPITDKNMEKKKLHEEYYEVDSPTLQSINRLKHEGKKLIAVGTTVVRTLESVAVENFITRESHHFVVPSKVKNFLPPPQSIFNKTDLFIFPPYDFKLIDVMITNFHLPKSSLMMLVEAFLQHKRAKKHLIELYNIAIKNDFRFYSFGDVMLIL